MSSTDQAVRPIDAYLPTADQAVALEGVRYAAEARCLAANGQPAVTNEPAGNAAFVRGSVRDRVTRSDLYGFFDTKTVAEFGYTRPPDVPGGVAITHEIPGVPEAIVNRCEDAGAQAITGTDPSALPDGGPPLVTSDPVLGEARDAWKRCVTKEGVLVQDPIQLESDHQSASAADVRIAQIDVDCKVSTNLVGIALARQAIADSQYITSNLAALKSYVARVAAVLSQGSR